MKRRENGFGSLEKRDNCFVARWKYLGKRMSKVIHTTSEEIAEKELEKITRPYREETKIEVLCNIQSKIEAIGELRKQEELRQDGILLEDLYDEFFASDDRRQVTDGTLKGYKGFCNRLNNWMKEKHQYTTLMKHIDEKIAKEFVSENLKIVTGGNINGAIVFFRYAWKLLAKKGCCKINPWLNINVEHSNESKRQSFTQDEVEKIIAAFEKRGMYDEIMLLKLSVYTGMRISDCGALSWSNVDLKKKIIKVIPIKTKRYHKEPIEIPIVDALYKDLYTRRCRQGGKEDCVFQKWFGKRIGNYHFLRIFNDILDALKIERYRIDENGRRKSIHSWHSFRHYFVSKCLDAGVSGIILSKLVGHRDIATTAKYSHSFTESLREKMNGFNVSEKKEEKQNALDDVYDPLLDETKEDTIKRLVEFWKDHHKSA